MINEKGIWEKIELPEWLIPNDRCYELFGLIAGVKRTINIESLFPGRGIPLDSSCPVYFRELHIHSKTYFMLSELKTKNWHFYRLDFSYFRIFFEHVLPRFFISRLSKDHEKSKIRIIIGFHNVIDHNAIKNKPRLDHVPNNCKNIVERAFEIKEIMKQEVGYSPNPFHLMRKLKITYDKAKEILEYLK